MQDCRSVVDIDARVSNVSVEILRLRGRGDVMQLNGEDGEDGYASQIASAGLSAQQSRLLHA